MENIEWLVCSKCGVTRIPAPAGATRQTEYTCRNCNPRPKYHPMDWGRQIVPGAWMSKQQMRWWNKTEASHRQYMCIQARYDLAWVVTQRLTIKLLKNILLNPFSAIQRARRLKEDWALQATLDSVAALPNRQLLPFLLVNVIGVPEIWAAESLRLSLRTIYQRAWEARRQLSRSCESSTEMHVIKVLEMKQNTILVG